MVYCERCGNWNSDENKFCGQCGTKLPEPKNYCPNCDIIYLNDNKFCTECGTKLVVKSKYLKSKSQNKNKTSPNTSNKNNNLPKNNITKPSQNNIKNSASSYNIKQNINKKETIVFIGEEESFDYSNYSDWDLERELEKVKNKYQECKKDRDPFTDYYCRKVYSIEAELSKRNKKIDGDELEEKLKKYKERKNVEKSKNKSSKPFKLDKKSNKKVKSQPKKLPPIYKNDSSETSSKRTKSKKNNDEWKICKKCYKKVLAISKSCPYCNFTKFYTYSEYLKYDYDYDQKAIKNRDISEIKSKRLKNKLRLMQK